MSSVESAALNNVTKYEYAQGTMLAEQVVLKEQAPSITTEGMKRIAGALGKVDPRYAERVAQSDVNFVLRKREYIASQNVEKTLPAAVEFLARAWLDNEDILPSDYPTEQVPLTTRCSEYDDYANGADIAKTLLLNPETMDEYGVPAESTFAFDITIAKRPETINGKFAPRKNGLPYGCTSLKYFIEKKIGEKARAKKGKDLVPRFVIGIDADCARKTLDIMNKDHDGVEGYLDEETPDSAEIKFKLLHEINTEARMFLSQLPEDPTDERAKTARGLFKLALDRSQESLEKVTAKILPIMTSPGEGSLGPSFSDPEVQVLTKYEQEDARKERFESAKDGIEYLSQKFRDEDGFHFDACYNAIITEMNSR